MGIWNVILHTIKLMVILFLLDYCWSLSIKAKDDYNVKIALNNKENKKMYYSLLFKYLIVPIIALGIMVWDFLTPISLAIKTIKIVVLIVLVVFLLMSLECLWILVSCCISGCSNEDGYLHSILRYVIITIIIIILIILTIKGLK